LKVHYYRHKMDDSAEEPVNDNRNIPEKLQNIPMSNKKIEAWKVQVAKEKSIFGASNVKSIHPVVDRIVTNLCKIDLINYIRVTKEDIYASNEIKIIGRTKMPISTPDHPYYSSVTINSLSYFMKFTNLFFRRLNNII